MRPLNDDKKARHTHVRETHRITRVRYQKVRGKTFKFYVTKQDFTHAIRHREFKPFFALHKELDDDDVDDISDSIHKVHSAQCIALSPSLSLQLSVSFDQM